jgi:hypothetical protein
MSIMSNSFIRTKIFFDQFMLFNYSRKNVNFYTREVPNLVRVRTTSLAFSHLPLQHQQASATPMPMKTKATMAPLE